MSPAVSTFFKGLSRLLSTLEIDDTIELIELLMEASCPLTDEKVEEKLPALVLASDMRV